MYEQWVAHPNKFAWVHRDDHATYSCRPGWWVSGRQLELDQLAEHGLVPVLRVSKADREAASRIRPVPQA